MCIGYIFFTYDMYKSSLRHIHDPVLSSLKMEGIRLVFFLFNRTTLQVFVTYLTGALYVHPL
jgi:hypothetical protein